jgi:flagellar basal-body rod modification protein FlgD
MVSGVNNNSQSNGANGSQSSTKSTSSDPYDSLNTEAFMKILVTEMSNQDPTQPMDSSQIVQQMSQIRSIQATSELTTTLQAVLLGQNVATASSLLGRSIAGLNDDGTQVSGVVSGVSVLDGQVKLYVGEDTVSLSNVEAIAADTSGSGS